MAGKKKVQQTAQPQTREEPVWPSWAQADGRARFSDPQHSAPCLRAVAEGIREGEYRLPRFQRPYRWTEEQVIRLFDSILHGYHVGSVLLWEQYRLPPSVEVFGDVTVESRGTHAYLVVDGQQRLGAIAMAAFSGRYYLDLQACALTTEPGPWREPAGYLLDRGHDSEETIFWWRRHAEEHGLDHHHVRWAHLAMTSLIESRTVSMVRIDYRWPLDRVMESYRRLNTEGTPMSAADLEEALRRANEGT